MVIGFAAEDGEDIARAQQKRERKGVDLIVLNDISDPAQGFDSDDNAVVLITATDETRIAAPRSRRSPRRFWIGLRRLSSSFNRAG